MVQNERRSPKVKWGSRGAMAALVSNLVLTTALAPL